MQIALRRGMRSKKIKWKECHTDDLYKYYFKNVREGASAFQKRENNNIEIYPVTV